MVDDGAAATARSSSPASGDRSSAEPFEIAVEIPVRRTGRVRQIESMFDVPAAEHARREWVLPLPLVDIAQADAEAMHGWNVGLIVGPSGSGKSTVARALWPERVVTGFEWPDDASVVDAIDAPIRDVVKALTSVGFGSPPSWLRPYHTLSTGEGFRATIARALLTGDSPVVIDEFTSVVDRQVAKLGAHATQKAVRRVDRRLVAVTCHYDVIEWLEPDWIYRPDTNELTWPRGSVQRPEIEVEIRGVGRGAWSLFRQHHYLSADLHVAARCVGAFIGDECVGFQAWYRFPHPRARDIMFAHRTVVLPDYQGIGLGGRLMEFVGQMLHTEGYRYHTTLAHPAMIAYMRRSPRWRELSANRPSRSRKPKRLGKTHASARKLATTSFAYVPLAI